MLTENQMNEVAEKYISDLANKTGIPVQIKYQSTVKKPYGHIYIYDSKKRIETGDDKYAIAGNAPFLVEIETGKIVVFGTARPKDYYIQEYEAGR